MSRIVGSLAASEPHALHQRTCPSWWDESGPVALPANSVHGPAKCLCWPTLLDGVPVVRRVNPLGAVNGPSFHGWSTPTSQVRRRRRVFTEPIFTAMWETTWPC